MHRRRGGVGEVLGGRGLPGHRRLSGSLAQRPRLSIRVASGRRCQPTFRASRTSSARRSTPR
eukprot:5832342-Pyramimonas_sp.AAC.1